MPLEACRGSLEHLDFSWGEGSRACLRCPLFPVPSYPVPPIPPLEPDLAFPQFLLLPPSLFPQLWPARADTVLFLFFHFTPNFCAYSTVSPLCCRQTKSSKHSVVLFPALHESSFLFQLSLSRLNTNKAGLRNVSRPSLFWRTILFYSSSFAIVELSNIQYWGRHPPHVSTTWITFQ